MKVVITESRLEKVVTDYLDDVYIPDYGWSENNRYGSYQEDVDKFGDLVFFINDEVSYSYYGCNAGYKNVNAFSRFGELSNYKCPLLVVHSNHSKNLTSVLGKIWEPIFKKWFEEHTGLKVTQLTTDYI